MKKIEKEVARDIAIVEDINRKWLTSEKYYSTWNRLTSQANNQVVTLDSVMPKKSGSNKALVAVGAVAVVVVANTPYGKRKIQKAKDWFAAI